MKNLKYTTLGGPSSSVGIMTGYGLDDPGIESQWGARYILIFVIELFVISIVYSASAKRLRDAQYSLLYLGAHLGIVCTRERERKRAKAA